MGPRQKKNGRPARHKSLSAPSAPSFSSGLCSFAQRGFFIFFISSALYLALNLHPKKSTGLGPGIDPQHFWILKDGLGVFPSKNDRPKSVEPAKPSHFWSTPGETGPCAGLPGKSSRSKSSLTVPSWLGKFSLSILGHQYGPTEIIEITALVTLQENSCARKWKCCQCFKLGIMDDKESWIGFLSQPSRPPSRCPVANWGSLKPATNQGRTSQLSS